MNFIPDCFRVVRDLRLQQLLTLSCTPVGPLPPRLPRSYPREQLDRSWQDVLLFQFHDVLPGSAIGLVYADALPRYAAMLQQLLELRAGAVNAIAGALTAGGAAAAAAVGATVGSVNAITGALGAGGAPAAAVGAVNAIAGALETEGAASAAMGAGGAPPPMAAAWAATGMAPAGAAVGTANLCFGQGPRLSSTDILGAVPLSGLRLSASPPLPLSVSQPLPLSPQTAVAATWASVGAPSVGESVGGNVEGPCRGVGYGVFNTLGFPRREVVEVKMQDVPPGTRVLQISKGEGR